MGILWKYFGFFEHFANAPVRSEVSVEATIIAHIFVIMLGIGICIIATKIISKYFVIINIKQAEKDLREMAEEMQNELDQKQDEITALRAKVKKYEAIFSHNSDN